MSPLLLIGIVMMGLPAMLIIGFATYIFFGFINDDKDARGLFNIALIVMGIGFVLILGNVLTTYVHIAW